MPTKVIDASNWQEYVAPYGGRGLDSQADLERFENQAKQAIIDDFKSFIIRVSEKLEHNKAHGSKLVEGCMTCDAMALLASHS